MTQSAWDFEREDAQFVTHETIVGKVFARLRYGSEVGFPVKPKCWSCGVLEGQYHVPGLCDVERCPRCGGQRRCCDCHAAEKKTKAAED